MIVFVKKFKGTLGLDMLQWFLLTHQELFFSVFPLMVVCHFLLKLIDDIMSL